ncbi:hypothetical protein QZH41_016852 [Actinostola sp. cb2023]|nr:hypothetical protein QZH41_016852 [Actinostola sp. cb2023]
MKRCLLLLVLLLSFAAISCQEDEETTAESMSTSNWVDPHNMVDDNPRYPKPNSKSSRDSITSAFANIQDELRDCKQRLQSYIYSTQGPIKEVPSCDTPYLKQIVRVLLGATSNVNPYTEVVLNAENREILRVFLDDKANIHDVTAILIDNITNKTLADSLKESYWNTIAEHFNGGNIILIVTIMLMILTVVVFEMRTRMTARQQFFTLLVVSFVISLPWEWVRMYKKEFAAKQSLMMKNIEKHCRTDHELGFSESLSLWWKSSFTFGDTSCSKYQEALLVDPIFEVAPSMAVSVTITRFIVQPFEHIADATGRSFRVLFQHLPIQWQPVMFLACLVVVILCLILISGIRISTPLFQIGVGVDPAVANAGIQRLENQIQQIIQQNAAIQNAAPAPAIENVRDDENRHAIQAILDRINAINDRTQQQDDQLREIREFLPCLRPVAEQARQAEAIEHLDWELLAPGDSAVADERPRLRRPVQASEHNPTENVGPNL